MRLSVSDVDTVHSLTDDSVVDHQIPVAEFLPGIQTNRNMVTRLGSSPF